MNLDQLSLDPNMHIHCHWIRWIWIRYYCIRIFCRWFRIRWIRCRWIHCCWIRWSLGPVVVAFIGPNIPKSLIYLASLIDKSLLSIKGALTTLTQTHTLDFGLFGLQSEYQICCILTLVAYLILIGFVYCLCSGSDDCILCLFLFSNFATPQLQCRQRRPNLSQLHLSFKVYVTCYCRSDTSSCILFYFGSSLETSQS